MVETVKVGKVYVEIGKNGLPLPSRLRKKDAGLKMKDKKGVLKVLKKNASGNLYWAPGPSAKRASPKRRSPPKRRASPKRRSPPKRRGKLTSTEKVRYRRQILSNLNDDENIRDIFMDVISKLN
jgi:hypothetical protein